MFKQENYQKYLDILSEELVPALGCTEPISVAYGAAVARKHLKGFPTKIKIQSSGNIIKNAKSVVVPNTGGLKGMQASLLAGAVGGDADKGMEVLSSMSQEDIDKVNELMNTGLVVVEKLNTTHPLHTITYVSDGIDEVEVEILDFHDNIIRITVNGKDVLKIDDKKAGDDQYTDRSILSIDQILDFIEVAKLEDYQDLLELQIANNTAVCEEGLKNDYGMNIGRNIIETGGGSLESLIKGTSAAGSDARMGGSAMPVVTNVGSGNNGICGTIPTVIYAREKGYSHEKMLKALLLADLVTIHVKTGIGRLSCFCGVVIASSGSAAAICYLDDCSREQIKMAITNVLGDVSGMICDGAKESCPAKIATAVDSALRSVNLAKENKVFAQGCGIVDGDVEATIKNVGTLASVGMKETDSVILDIMTNIEN
ncbi:L-serine ammonia-lyase, iron-sulfur-dependent, subunit alpha [Erysipelotrichaceae bacterium OttesenSCG-928-M19]|nr:L-serine ammonia-lyase, iron-sulfur-dependent, subunit alpha [Erysipelotrichaceae bacterium OttesenSCG-928-M19]